jgi:LacI family transcriptional regulator, repressor for deo operon, udp, cdd, tsx, nupC, and nupG
LSTIYDVARLANVSPKTVSRVLNEPHLVKEETREHVNTVIEKLDYHPNAIAASLKRQCSNIIGFVVPYGSDFVLHDPNMMEQLRGAHDLLTREGYEVLISMPVYKSNTLHEISRLVKHRNVDGVILYPSAGIEQILKGFTEKHLFYVSLGKCYEHQFTNFVDINMKPGAYAATKYLLSTGHRHIGLVNKPHSFFMFENNDLLIAYQTALQEAEKCFTTDLIIEGDFTFEGGYQSFQKLYKLNPSMSAVICASDPMAYGVIKAINDAGLVANKDIEVISGDNHALTQKLYPFICSIHNPAYEQGNQAGKMISSIIRSGQEVLGINLNTQFVIRGNPIY